MRNAKMFLIIAAAICLNTDKIEAVVTLDDGAIHNIDWVTNNGYHVKNSTDGAFTTVNILAGGKIEGMGAYNDSQITFSGGDCKLNFYAYDRTQVMVSAGNFGANLFAYNSSQVTISGGVVHKELLSNDNSQVTILGGQIKGYLRAEEDSHVTISGGDFGGKLCAYQNSIITIYGSNFNYPYGKLSGSGTLTGILESGEIINNQFWNDPYGSPSIFLVPEPSAFGLLAFGSLALLRKRRA